MKKFTNIALFFILILLAFQANSQNLIAVQNGSTPKFYQQVDNAITNSVDGDTIFIPGGSWNISTPINKRLHLIGVGHHLDSTKVTFPTTLTSNIWLAAGASNGSLTGVFLKGILFGSNVSVIYYSVTRCHISEGIRLDQSNSDFSFIENIIEGVIINNSNASGASNCSFLNNIINAGFYINYSTPFSNSIFKNNLFLTNGYCNYGCSYCIAGQYLTLENNVFINFNIASLGAVSNSITKNNLFVETLSLTNSTNVGTNNIVGQPQTNIFVTQEGYVYNYAHNYRLQASSPGKNAGTDGTDMGIYGGIYPWKEGSIPSNPHFQQINISPKTDNSGNLNVKIKVAAQDN